MQSLDKEMNWSNSIFIAVEIMDEYVGNCNECAFVQKGIYSLWRSWRHGSSNGCTYAWQSPQMKANSFYRFGSMFYHASSAIQTVFFFLFAHEQFAFE